MSSPARPAPIPTTAATASDRELSRKRSRVLQSSLDLVFSYSRSQQILYGKTLHSAPSFIDTASLSHSPEGDDYLHRRDGEGDLEQGSPADEEAEDEYTRRDERDEDGGEGGGGADARGEEDEEDSRPSSGSQMLFAADPVVPHSAPVGPISASQQATPRPGMVDLLPDRPRVSSRAASKISWGADTAGSRAVRAQSPASASASGNGTGDGLLARKFPERELKRDLSPTERADGAGRGSPFDIIDESTPLVPPSYASSPKAEGGAGREGAGGMYGSVGGGGMDALTAGGGRRRSSAKGDLLRRRSSGRRRSLVFTGQSTDGQTLFNAVAVLLGIGILSLPLALAYAGWIAGTAMLVGFAWLTCYTAKLLAKLIRADGALMGYTDIGRAAFGRGGGLGINAFVALIVLFGDTLEAIYPHFSSNTYKLLGLVFIVPTTLLPLHLLSLPSLLSTISTIMLVIIILLDGFIKTSSPGSIIHPAPTSVGPEWEGMNWLGGIGLVLAGFGGHAVVPSLARDMRHPEHFDRVINWAFGIAAGVSFIAGAAGYLMIGNVVSDEITRDLMQPKYGYPRVLNLIALWMIVIIPLTKFGLCSRPLNITIETLLGMTAPNPTIDLSETAISDASITDHPSAASPGLDRRLFKVTAAAAAAAAVDAQTPKIGGIPRYKVLRVFSRTIVTLLCTATAIVLPGFGKVMAFLGSFSAFLICIILPLGFYLRLGPRLVPEHTSAGQRVGQWGLIGLSVVLMVAGTVWAFLPDSGHGGLEA